MFGEGKKKNSNDNERKRNTNEILHYLFFFSVAYFTPYQGLRPAFILF